MSIPVYRLLLARQLTPGSATPPFVDVVATDVPRISEVVLVNSHGRPRMPEGVSAWKVLEVIRNLDNRIILLLVEPFPWDSTVLKALGLRPNPEEDFGG